MVDDRGPDDDDAPAEPEFGSSEWLLQQLSGGRLTAPDGREGLPPAGDPADAPGADPGAVPAPEAPAAPKVAAAADRTPSVAADTDVQGLADAVAEQPAGFVWHLTPGVGTDPLVEEATSSRSAPAEDTAHAATTPIAESPAPTTPRPAPPTFFEALRMPEPPSWSTAPAEEPPSGASDGGATAAREGDHAESSPDGQRRAPEPSSWNPFARPASAADPSSAAEPVVPTAAAAGATPGPMTEPVIPAAPFVLSPPALPTPTATPPRAPFDARTPPTPPPLIPERTPEESAFFTRPVDAQPSLTEPPAAAPVVPPAPAAQPAPATPVEPPPPQAAPRRSNPFETGVAPTLPAAGGAPEAAAADEVADGDSAPAGEMDAEASEGHGLAALLGFFDASDDDEADRPSSPTSRSVIGDTTGIISLPPASSAASDGPAAPPSTSPDTSAPATPAATDGPAAPFGAAPWGPGAPVVPSDGRVAAAAAPTLPPVSGVTAPFAPGAASRDAGADDDRDSSVDTPTTKLDTREIAALLSARTGDPDPDNAPRERPAIPPLEDATLLMGALPSPATQPLDAASLADVSEPIASTTAIPSTTVLPVTPPPGGTGGGPASGGGSPSPGHARSTRLLYLVAGGLAIVLVLIGLFALGTRLPALFAAPVAAPAASASAAAKQTSAPPPAPTATPAPTIQPKPAGPQPAGDHAWNTLGGGECIQPYSTPWAETFTVVDCASPHAGQLVYTNLVSADPAAPYPGADALAQQITALCTAPGLLDLNAAAAYPNLQVQGAFPATEDQWKGGQRSYYCFASRAGGEPMTSSVAGPGPTG